MYDLIVIVLGIISFFFYNWQRQNLTPGTIVNKILSEPMKNLVYN